MSCKPIATTTNCPCDERVWPPALDIPAGLADLPRQLVDFTDLRTAMLARVRSKGPLGGWEARDRADYGVMLLELWAWVGEVLSIYDKAIADETYPRTAKLRPSLRRMMALLGYLPRPAVASTVELALIADGKRKVVVPAGTAFRSSAVGADPPQVFEMAWPATIHPAVNRFAIETPRRPDLVGWVSQLQVDAATSELNEGDIILVELSSLPADGHVRRVVSTEGFFDDDGRRLIRVTLDRAVDAGTGKAIAGVRIRKPSRSARLKVPSSVGGESPSFWVLDEGTRVFILDAVHPSIELDERVLVSFEGDHRWMTVHGRWVAQMALAAQSTSPTVYVKKDATTVTHIIPGVTIPAVRSPHTLVYTLDDINAVSRRAPGRPAWTQSFDPTGFEIKYGLRDAGTVVGALLPTLTPANFPRLAPGLRAPTTDVPQPRRYLLADSEERGVAVGGNIFWPWKAFLVDGGTTWSPPLATPVEGFGNVVAAIRGESVRDEVLGSGDASVPLQSFTLKKSPLTYVAVPGASNDAGIASTLHVWVDGLEWVEVPSFFGHGPFAQVFVVRQDDAGDSIVTFGDGVRGARLPTGVDNVVATYRFGAGAASPPAGGITQLAGAVPGVASVVSPVAAGGGADAESAESLRELAPPSALLLGRAISILDFEVAARLAPGVKAARAEWRWDGKRQRPVVKVWAIGDDPLLDDKLTERLRGLADPDTPIDVEKASPVAVRVDIDLETDPRRVAAAVVASVTEALTGEGGLLTPGRLGIGTALFRSVLYADLLALTGVGGVRGLSWNGGPFPDFPNYGVVPGAGKYFDFTVAVTGSKP